MGLCQLNSVNNCTWDIALQIVLETHHYAEAPSVLIGGGLHFLFVSPSFKSVHARCVMLFQEGLDVQEHWLLIFNALCLDILVVDRFYICISLSRRCHFTLSFKCARLLHAGCTRGTTYDWSIRKEWLNLHHSTLLPFFFKPIFFVCVLRSQIEILLRLNRSRWI